jgi:DNA-binding IclR family transcriptional regulator
MTYPITELFAWVIDDETGQHGIVGVAPGFAGGLQAVSSRRDLIDRVKPIAQSAAEATGKTVMLQRFVLAETAEILTP